MADTNATTSALAIFEVHLSKMTDSVGKPVTKLALLKRLDDLRPAAPFDLEPQLMDETRVMYSFNQFCEQEDLRQQYDNVRLWHALRERVLRMRFQSDASAKATTHSGSGSA